MIVTIFVSLLPLAVKDAIPFWIWTERITTLIFVIDYVFRWTTADLKLGKGVSSFLIYPFSAMAVIDLLSILPTFIMVNSA